MPTYLILDRALLEAATVARVSTSDAKSAIEAVPASTPLPERVYVLQEDRLKGAFVVGSEGEASDPIVVRAEGVQEAAGGAPVEIPTQV